MAKWGERDPRWLVEHRQDGKNVNGWHWEEKNRLEWSRQRISELLQPLMERPIVEQGISVSLVQVKDVTGEAVITTRKGNKRFAVYDLKIAVNWEAEAADSKDKVKGELQVSEFASHSDPEDYLVTSTVEGTGALQDTCKALVMQFQAGVLCVLQQYVADINALL